MPTVAVRLAVCVELTVETVAVKLAEADPAETVRLEGTVTAELLLASDTITPPLGAVPLNVAVHKSVPDVA